jgi:hypothetical protein
MIPYVSAILIWSINFIAFDKQIQCECEHSIGYYVGKDSTFIWVEACHLPKIETSELNDSTRVFIMVQSCKGKGLVQVYKYDKLIEEKHYKNAIKLNRDTFALINFDGVYLRDTILGRYYPEYKK